MFNSDWDLKNRLNRYQSSLKPFSEEGCDLLKKGVQMFFSEKKISRGLPLPA